MFTDKVYTGLDHAPAAFDLRGRILGPNGNNLEYIKSETGAVVILRGGSGAAEPLHVVLQHSRSDKITDARNLMLNLIETVKNELQQWTVQTDQTIAPAQATVPPPIPSGNNIQETVNIAPANITPAVANTGVVNSPVVAVRPQTVFQLMPQQQYILNQDGSQLIPLIQQGVQMSAPGNYTHLTTLPIGSFPQTSVGGTQFVDANLQPVSMAQFRLSVPNSMPAFIQNGIAFSQVSLANQDTTTVSYTSLLPVSSTVSSPSTGLASQPVGPSTPHKVAGDKSQYQVQAGEPVQLASSQTMYIPYQQLHDLTSAQNGATIQPQVLLSGGGSMNAWQNATPMSIPHITHLPPGASLNPNILQLNQKTGQVLSGQPMQISASQGTTLTPIPSNNQWVRPPSIAASLPQGAELIPLNTPVKGSQESRGQKRTSDGTPSNQIQLRPIAPAGSQTGAQDKSSNTRDIRWSGSSARGSGSHNIQSLNKGTSRNNSSSNTGVSQASATSVTITARDRQHSLLANQGEKCSTQTRSEHDASIKYSDSKVQPLPNNIHMYAVSNMHGMQSLTHTPSSMTQASGQLNQMYIVPSSQTAGLQALPHGTVMGHTLQMGQGNVPMIQPNQISLPQGVHYNTVPLMQLPQHMQYITPGINLNNQAAAQQLGLTMSGQQIINPAMLANLQSNNPNQLAQLNSPTIQGQMIAAAPPPNNIQFSATPLQNGNQIVPINSQQEVNTSGVYAPNQFPTQQGNIILPAQHNLQQQYPVSQQMSTTSQLNQNTTTLNPSQQSSYPTSITPNTANQQSPFPSGVPQQYVPGTAMAQMMNQQYPSVGSPSVNQAQVRVTRVVENTSGVTTVSLLVEEGDKSLDPLRLAGLAAGGHRLSEAKKAFRDVLMLLIKLASLRYTCVILDESMRATMSVFLATKPIQQVSAFHANERIMSLLYPSSSRTVHTNSSNDVGKSFCFPHNCDDDDLLF